VMLVYSDVKSKVVKQRSFMSVIYSLSNKISRSMEL